MNEASFLQAGNNFYFPTCGRSHPLQKRLRISRVSQRAGGDNPDWIGDHLLGCPMKTAQYLYRFGDRFGSKKAGAKHSFAEARDFTILVDGAKPAPCEACDLQANGIRTDINRGKCRHEARSTVYMPNKSPGQRRFLCQRPRSTPWLRTGLGRVVGNACCGADRLLFFSFHCGLEAADAFSDSLA